MKADKNTWIIIGVVIALALTYFVFTGEEQTETIETPETEEAEIIQPQEPQKIGGYFDVYKYPADSPTQLIAEIAGKLFKSFP